MRPKWLFLSLFLRLNTLNAESQNTPPTLFPPPTYAQKTEKAGSQVSRNPEAKIPTKLSAQLVHLLLIELLFRLLNVRFYLVSVHGLTE